jgi:hypothetical protein
LILLIFILSALHDFKIGPKAVEQMRNRTYPQNFRKLTGLIGKLNFLLGTIMLILGILIVRGC